MHLTLILPAVIAFIGVFVLIPLGIKLAHIAGFVDEPGGRKDHADPVPPIGGLVILPIYMIVIALALPNALYFWPLFAALTLILIVGGLDDYMNINPWPRFIAQFVAAALIVIPGQAQLYHLGDLFGLGAFELGWMSIPFSIIAVVLLINAINLMDGLDGLVAGKSFVIMLWLALACVFSGHYAALGPLLPLMGALAGFLVYNMRHPLREKAAIFLGDAGSMGLAVVVAWFAIGLAQEPDPVLVPISMAWILALPIFDVCAQFYRRVREGRHPFSPDRGHFHHHFVHAGVSVGASTALILVIGFVLGGVGYVGVSLGVPQFVLTSVWICLLLLHIAISENPDTSYIKWIKSCGNG